MTDFPLHFTSTLPRSGSTLLQNLLGQNPAHHVTPTNDLINLFIGMRDEWHKMESFRAQGLDKIKPKVTRAMCGMLYGFYSAEFGEGKTVFDKSRGWLAYIELLEEVLQRPVKMLVTVRDMRAIIASFEKLHRKSAMVKHKSPGASFFECQTITGRARQILSPSAVVGLSVNRVRDALDRGFSDRMCIIPYRRLCQEPQKQLDRVHAFLGLPPFTYEPNNVKQVTWEDDGLYGFTGLHEIRPQVVQYEGEPWKGVLPDKLLNQLSKEYADINKLAAA